MGNSTACTGDCRSHLESCQENGKLVPLNRAFDGANRDGGAEEVVNKTPSKSGTLPKVGQRVMVSGQRGQCRFVGDTQFATGTWIGVELDEPASTGRHDGTVRNVAYFSCAKDKGVFVRPRFVIIENHDTIPDEAAEGNAEATAMLAAKINDEQGDGGKRVPGTSAKAKAKPSSSPKNDPAPAPKPAPSNGKAAKPSTKEGEAPPTEERAGSKGRVPGATAKKPKQTEEEVNDGGDEPVESAAAPKARVAGAAAPRKPNSEERPAPSGAAPSAKGKAKSAPKSAPPTVPADEEEARKDAPEGPRESKGFLVHIDKGVERKKLGADTTTTGASPYLKIVRVKPDGLIAAWNAENPGSEVKAGHFIIEVNGVKGSKDKLYDIIVKEQKLTFLVTAEP